MNEQTKDHLGLIYALYGLIALLGCPCVFYTSLFVVRDAMSARVIIGVVPFLFLGMVLLVSIRPTKDADTRNMGTHCKSVGFAMLLMTLISLLVVLLGGQSHNPNNADQHAFNLAMLITIIAIEAAGFFGGLAIVLLGNYWFRYTT